MNPLFQIPEDFTVLTAEQLEAFIAESQELLAAVAANPSAYTGDAAGGRTSRQLVAELSEGVAAIEAARAQLAEFEPAEPVEAELSEAELAEQVAELASRAVFNEDEPEDETPEDEPEDETPVEEPAVETPAVETPAEEPVAEAAVVAAAVPAPVPLPRPSRSRAATPVAQAAPQVALVAGAGSGLPVGTELEGGAVEVARLMQRRRANFGNIPDGVRGEKIPIALADWSELYPAGRHLREGASEQANMALIAAALDPEAIKAEMRRRRAGGPSLVASGGLCAPVTPFYQLQVISQAARPVRAALPAFAADRGGIRFGRPPGLSSITDGVGLITAAEDAAGGTFATKSCQVVDCPDFEEVDVSIIFHCLQFGNLGARTYPERVAQANQLVLAAQARLAEAALLTAIDAASTAVTASDLGLGATGALLGQVLAAANGMRNRNRMDPEAVLRLMLPDWAVDLMISDVIRSQFQRFDTDEAKITALLRSFDVEPTFYIDGASGKAQIFPAQTAGDLLPFPDTVNWFLYPEGSFLFLDGGTLELGLVRDSILNSTNDFQIFGETFENVAFIGVEALSVVSTVCDSGAVSAPVDVTECGDYSA